MPTELRWPAIFLALFAAFLGIWLAMSVSLAQLKAFAGLSSPGGIWRTLAIIFALLNLKNLPFVWHVSE